MDALNFPPKTHKYQIFVVTGWENLENHVVFIYNKCLVGEHVVPNNTKETGNKEPSCKKCHTEIGAGCILGIVCMLNIIYLY